MSKIFAAVGVWFLAVQSLAQDIALLNRVKAVFIYNFIDYVVWPDNLPEQELRIGILGDSPIEGFLKEITRKQINSSRRLVVESFANIEEVVPYQVLFVSEDCAEEIGEIGKVVEKNNIPTISDTRGLAAVGTAINLIVSEPKLKFEINRQSIKRTDLRVSS